MDNIISARALALRSHRGTVFGPVDLDITPGITVLQGPVGSGRTTLLLTLSGRMRPSSGTAKTLGFALPKKVRQVQKLTGIAGFTSIDDLDGMLTVADVIRERRAWLGPWFAFVARPDEKSVKKVLQPVFGDDQPSRDTRIWSLNEAQQLKLKLALALMAKPAIVFIDAIEQIQSESSRVEIWAALSSLAARGVSSVVSAASDDTRLWDGLEPRPVLIHVVPEAVSA